MGYVYVIYSRESIKDDKLYGTIIKNLQERGVRTWVDVEDISPGEAWSKSIKQAISEADAVLLLLSKYAIDSEYINYEAAYALDNQKEVYVVATDNVDNWQIPASLQGIYDAILPPHISISNLSDEETVASELDKLEKMLPPGVKSKEVEVKEARSKGYVFISYCMEDLEFVEKLREFFKNKGYAYWDYQQATRKYHMPLHLELEEAVERASVMVSVVSPDWKKSTWAAKEYLFAQEVSVPNFVCIWRSVGPTLLISDVTHIDFTLDEDDGFDKLDKALQREGLI